MCVSSTSTWGSVSVTVPACVELCVCVCQTRADLGRDCYGTVALASCLGFVCPVWRFSLSSCFWSVKRQFDAFAPADSR